jgi:hypothetical protein
MYEIGKVFTSKFVGTRPSSYIYIYKRIYRAVVSQRLRNTSNTSTKNDPLEQCFSTAGPHPGAGPWQQLYRAARDPPGICHFSFLSIFLEYIFYSGNILRRKIVLNVPKSSDPERLNNICVANVSDKDLISPVIDN